MKRGFLFGLGTFFILGVLYGFVQIFRGDFVIGGIFALICVPLSPVIIYAAHATPVSLSRVRTIVGWLMGFLVIDVVFFGTLQLIDFAQK